MGICFQKARQKQIKAYLLASALDLKQNSRMAMNMAKTRKAAKKKNTPTTLANESTPRLKNKNKNSLK